MKKFLTIIALATSLTAFADDYSLYYDLTSGVKNTEVSAVSNLQKLVFDKEGNMIVYKKDGKTETISISSVSRLFFSTPQTVEIKAPQITSNYVDGTIYDLTGRKVSVNSSNEKLPRGIYIINGKKTLIK